MAYFQSDIFEQLEHLYIPLFVRFESNVVKYVTNKAAIIIPLSISLKSNITFEALVTFI